MRFEKVHTVWHFHDRVRSGIADFQGAPHYFEAPFDDELDDYQTYFLLYAVEVDILDQVLRQDEVFREWEGRFYNNHAPLDSHPMLGDPPYRERHEWLENQFRSLLPLTGKYDASFRKVPGPDSPSMDVMGELEVCWSAASA